MPVDSRLHRSELLKQSELPTRQFGRVVQVCDPKSPPWRRREHLAIQAPVAARDLGPGEALGVLSTCGRHDTARAGQMFVEGLGQRPRIPGRDEQTCVEALQGVGEPADAAGDNGSVGG